MQDIMMAVLDSIDEHVASDSKKRQIYAEIVPCVLMYDEELASSLSSEYPLFSEILQEIMEENDFGDE